MLLQKLVSNKNTMISTRDAVLYSVSVSKKTCPECTIRSELNLENFEVFVIVIPHLFQVFRTVSH